MVDIQLITLRRELLKICHVHVTLTHSIVVLRR
jgi:hypothetical protein